jgi:surface protein
MKFMFYYAEALKQDLSSWDNSAMTIMKFMFYYAEDFISDYAEAFNQDLNSLGVSAVTSMKAKFAFNDALNQNNFAVSTMKYTFYYAEAFDHFLDWNFCYLLLRLSWLSLAQALRGKQCRRGAAGLRAPIWLYSGSVMLVCYMVDCSCRAEASLSLSPQLLHACLFVFPGPEDPRGLSWGLGCPRRGPLGASVKRTLAQDVCNDSPVSCLSCNSFYVNATCNSVRCHNSPVSCLICKLDNSDNSDRCSVIHVACNSVYFCRLCCLTCNSQFD